MAWAVRVYHALENGDYEKEPLNPDTIFECRENAEHYAHELECKQTNNEFLFEIEEVKEGAKT